MGKGKVSIADLEEKDKYSLIEELDHQDMVPFIMKEFQNRNLIIHLYVIINISIVTAGIIFAINQQQLGTISFFSMFLWWIGGAVAGSTLVIPFHELLHGITYYLLGAKKVSYGGNLRDFYFFATADHFIVTGKTIWPLALAPFLVVGSLCVWALQSDLSTGIKCLFWGMLTLHSLNCLGDFGILSYFWERREKKIYTYDRVKEAKSYIYQEQD
ncbi:MAG TPA: DUF3267 domain-containing protein [Saprospiraceae bacterium]|nr:DUF3267 domain-containing protein [Saprospiraceae bacterium]